MKIQGEEYHGTYYDHWRFDGVFLSPANECKVVELDLYNSYDYYLVTIIGITKQISKKKTGRFVDYVFPLTSAHFSASLGRLLH